jgi:hypothetical protein
MDWIISKRIKILAGDIPCYDDIKDPDDSKNLPNLRKLYLSGAICVLLLSLMVINLKMVELKL